MILDGLNNQEIALLLATKASENVQSLVELCGNAEAPIRTGANAIDSLVRAGILEEVDSFDGIRYGFPDNPIAQQVCDEIYGSL